jgi:AraC-like DNA-binding protein
MCVDMKSGVDIWWMNGINGDNGVNLILLLLLENISLSWNLETLAREYGLSYSSLFSFFRRASKYVLF